MHHTWKNRMLSLAAIAALAGLGTLMTPRRSAADDVKTVNIAPLPLPVAASQHGPWTVALGGTPTVNVANQVGDPPALPGWQ